MRQQSQRLIYFTAESSSFFSFFIQPNLWIKNRDSRRVKRIPALRTHVEDGQSPVPTYIFSSPPLFFTGGLKGEILPVFSSHSHSEGHDLKKQTKIQKSKAVASPTQDRALILRKPRAVKFSTCPLNAPVRGAGCRVGSTPEHFIYFNFQHPQQCGEHPHQEMASYGPDTNVATVVNQWLACR